MPRITRNKKIRAVSSANAVQSSSRLVQTKLSFLPVLKNVATSDESVLNDTESDMQMENFEKDTFEVFDSESENADDHFNVGPDDHNEVPSHTDDTMHSRASDRQDYVQTSRTYQEQIQEIITSVLSEEMHLFTQEQLNILLMYQDLCDDGKLAFFRLLNRKYKWHRASTFMLPRDGNSIHGSKEETPREASIVSENVWCQLERFGLVERPTCSSPDKDNDTVERELSIWIGLCSREDLVLLCKKFNLPIQGIRVNDLSNRLLHHLKHECGTFALSKEAKPRTTSSEIIQCTLDHLKSTVIGTVIRITSFVRDTFHRLFIVYLRTRTWPDNDAFLLDSILSNASLENNSKRYFVQYACPRHSLVWPTRDDLDAYIWALKLELSLSEVLQEGTQKEVFEKAIEHWNESGALELWNEAVENKATHVTGIPMFNTYTNGWVLTRCYERIAYCLFRLKRHQEACDVYTSLLSQRLFHLARRGSWYDELTRMLDLYIDKRKAFRVCEEALADTWVKAGTGRRYAVVKRLKKLEKTEKRVSLAIVHEPEMRRRAVPQVSMRAPKQVTDTTALGRKAVYLDENGTPMGVEALALQHYLSCHGPGWKGLHTENSIITTLFSLCFWDILLDDRVPGAFHHPYQRFPEDLFTEFFYEARKDEIEKRLSELEVDGWKDQINQVWEREAKYKTACIGINWDRFTKQDLLDIAECMGGRSLSKICGLFAKTYWAHGGGLPDLCLWKPSTESQRGDLKLVEVKGEGDRLSDKQVVWQQYLLEFGIKTETFHVYVSKKTKRKVS